MIAQVTIVFPRPSDPELLLRMRRHSITEEDLETRLAAFDPPAFAPWSWAVDGGVLDELPEFIFPDPFCMECWGTGLLAVGPGRPATFSSPAESDCEPCSCVDPDDLSNHTAAILVGSDRREGPDHFRGAA